MTNYVNSIKHAARVLQHKSQRNMNNTHTLTSSLCVGRGRSSKHTRYLVIIWSPLYGIITRLCCNYSPSSHRQVSAVDGRLELSRTCKGKMMYKFNY